MDTNELKNDKDYLMEVCKGLEELRLNNKHDIRQSQTEAFTGVNKALADLNKFFFTITSLLIPAIYTLASLDETRTALTSRQSGFLVISLLSLLLSLLFGIGHMIIEINFYKKWLKVEDKKLRIWGSESFWPGVPTVDQIARYFNDYDVKMKDTSVITGQTSNESQNAFLILQGIYMLCGIILISIVAIGLLPD